MTTTVYLDFGARFPAGGLQMRADELRDILGPDSGPELVGDLNDDDIDDTTADTVLTFRSLDSLVRGPGSFNIDFDGNRTVNSSDTTALQNSIVAIMQRQFAPFDVNVQVASAASLADVRNTLRANDGAPVSEGSHDAYVFVSSVTAGGMSVGQLADLYGLAAGRDFDAGANQTDEAVVVFADTLFDPTLNLPPDVAVANLAAHEAGHTFGLRHTNTGVDGDGAPLPAPANTNLPLLNASNLMEEGGGGIDSLKTISLFTRFDIMAGDGNTDPALTENAYNDLIADQDIGFRDANRDGLPDLAYVTGTGAFDRIRLTKIVGTQATLVQVTAFADQTMTRRIGEASYLVNDSAGMIVEAGARADEVIVDARIGSIIRVRGGAGVDRLIVEGNGVTGGAYRPLGVRNLLPGGQGDRAGSISAGSTLVEYSELETEGSITVRNLNQFTFVTPNRMDNVTVAASGVGNRVAGASSGFAWIPLLVEGPGRFTIDAGASDFTSGADSITVNSLAAGTDVAVWTGDGADVVTVGRGNLDTVRGRLSVDGGGGGIDSLFVVDGSTVNSVTARNSVTYDIGAEQLTRTNRRVNPTVNRPAVTYTAAIEYRNFEAFDLTASQTGNTIVVRGSPAGTSLSIAAGNGADTVDIEAARGVVTVAAMDGIDTLGVGRLGGALSGVTGHVTMRGESGVDTLWIGDHANVARANYACDDDSLSDPSRNWTGEIVFTSLENVNLLLGSGGASVQLTSVSPAVNLNVYGGSASDTIAMPPATALRGRLGVHGGGGVDTIDYSAYLDAASAQGPGVTIDLATAAAPGLAGGFSGFENVNGTAASDYLLGDGGRNVIRGMGGVDTLIGGGGDDDLYGGEGDDLLIGGLDNDLLVGEGGDDRLMGESAALGLDRMLQLSFRPSWTNWGGAREKWVSSAAGDDYYLTPAGELYLWDEASGPGFSDPVTGQPVPLRGTSIVLLSAVYYDDIGLLVDAQPGVVEIAPSAADRALDLDRRYGFGDVQAIDAAGWGGNEKWLQDSAGAWYYLTRAGELYAENEDPRFPGALAALGPAFYAQPELLTRAAGSPADNLAADLDRSLGLWSDGNLWFDWAGRQEKWILDRDSNWHFIEPNGAVYRWSGSGPTGTLLGVLDASYWEQPEKLCSAYTGRLTTRLTASSGYRDDDILVGSQGDDALDGGDGRNLLIGGRDADALGGGAGDDILIGGYTTFDELAVNAAALRSIGGRWANAGASYESRVLDVSSSGQTNWILSLIDRSSHWEEEWGTGEEPRLRSVWDDGSVDSLSGAAGRDWFFASLADSLPIASTDERIDRLT